LPEVLTSKPGFRRGAAITALVLWLLILVSWTIFGLSLAASSSHAPDSRGILGVYGLFGMILWTIALFVAGLVVLTIEGVGSLIRSRRYRLYEEALGASRTVPPPAPKPWQSS
jgi:vacuolar-type H+-ATPase subunit I/STV1